VGYVTTLPVAKTVQRRRQSSSFGFEFIYVRHFGLLLRFSVFLICLLLT
jgi:hypothetical protein